MPAAYSTISGVRRHTGWKHQNIGVCQLILEGQKQSMDVPYVVHYTGINFAALAARMASAIASKGI
jgi:hypothetical protein